MRTDSNSYRRDYVRALAQRVEVDAKELRIMGSKSALLRTLVGASGAKTAQFGTEVAHATRFERLAFAFGAAPGIGVQSTTRTRSDKSARRSGSFGQGREKCWPFRWLSLKSHKNT